MNSDRNDRVRTAAILYYLQQETMEGIARQLGVSRSTVSRLLTQARESGLVRINIIDDPASNGLAARVQEHFGVTAHIAPVTRSTSTLVRLDAAAQLAANLLTEWFDHGLVLGVAWGTTVSAVAQHLPHRPLRRATVVQLNGAANPHSTGLAYAGTIMTAFGSAFDAGVLYFPVPAFFDFPETRSAMWNERSVRRVLEVQQKADIALFGIGSPTGDVPSQVYAGGYLDQRDQRVLVRESVVGDVCTVLLRADGSFADIELNKRATGPTPRALARIPRRVCVVAGDGKVQALLAALRAGVITDLVIDEVTAESLLAQGGACFKRRTPGSRAHAH